MQIIQNASGKLTGWPILVSVNLRPRNSRNIRICAIVALSVLTPKSLCALDAEKRLSQYTRTVWTQADGLPQDTIRAIAQTIDGYLWLGTDEGLCRFDGYDFTVYHKNNSVLPDNSISALASGPDGSLWIGTSRGLVLYRDGHFTIYSRKDGLPDDVITTMVLDHTGALWVVAGAYLSRFNAGSFRTYVPEKDIPLSAVRAIYEDHEHTLWVSGYGGLARFHDGRFVNVFRPSRSGVVVTTMAEDRHRTLWFGSNNGLYNLSITGTVIRLDTADGLPDRFIRSLRVDRDGNVWAGTQGGLSRLDRRGKFSSFELSNKGTRDWVRSIFEDREGNLWIGMNSGLNRLRDDVFTIYAQSEGMPSDLPTTVYEDRRGRIWIGFYASGLAVLDKGSLRAYTVRDGLASNEIFSIREDHDGNLLVATREGLSRLRGGRFVNTSVEDRLGRRVLFDILEDRRGRLWSATGAGLSKIESHKLQLSIPGGPLLKSSMVILYESSDGSLWAGSYGNGLWHLKDGNARQFTISDGLSSEQIRSITEDSDGTLWIGTFGGGLNAFKHGRFSHFTARNGLLSDNIAHVLDDGNGSLWLSTTQGICSVRKSALQDFAGGKVMSIAATYYGVEDGLRSAQCAPGYPTSRGGTKTRDGRLWFPTTHGIAVLDPHTPKRKVLPPLLNFVEVKMDGASIHLNSSVPPGNGRLQLHYTAIHLSAPERVRYSYKLQGLDSDWIDGGHTRIVNYNGLSAGDYQFFLRASITGETSAQALYTFKVLPHFHETLWFRCFVVAAVVGLIGAAYFARLRYVRGQFRLVLEERARLAREIHDSLAQGFVGISSQLDAVSMCMSPDSGAANQYLETARRMARHSLTEARRAVMDLRTSALDDQCLQVALQTVTRQLTAASNLHVDLDVAESRRRLPEEMEHNLLRITQEAVSNAVKHARAKRLSIRLRLESTHIDLNIEDDGIGFEQSTVFSIPNGHFGLIGMRERTERLGGTLTVKSQLGSGTLIQVILPLT